MSLPEVPGHRTKARLYLKNSHHERRLADNMACWMIVVAPANPLLYVVERAAPREIQSTQTFVATSMEGARSFIPPGARRFRRAIGRNMIVREAWA